MRLTNITQVSLSAGRLRSFAVRAAEPTGQRLPVSFDQGRHVSEGDRPGSWMAVAFRLPASALVSSTTPDAAPGSVDPDALALAWQAVIARHGTLRTVFSRDSDGELHLDEYTIEPQGWTSHEIPDGVLPREVIRDLFDEVCRPFAGPSYRLALLEPEGEPPQIVIGSDHSHVDMWSMLVLAHDLVADLQDVIEGREPGIEMPAAHPFAEHTARLEAAPPAPEVVHTRWAQVLDAEDGHMPTFPLDLGDVSTPVQEVVEVRDVFDAAGLARFTAAAEVAGVRLLPLAMSVLTTATQRLSGKPLRAVFPVHSRNESLWLDSVGWFITNSVLEIDSDSPAECAASTKEALRLGSYPLAPILAPYGGMPATPGMFALSWLDTRRLPVALDPEMNVQYVSASLKVDGVMIWFIVNDSGLHLRCRYPDTPQARANVGTWLDAVGEGLLLAAVPVAVV